MDHRQVLSKGTVLLGQYRIERVLGVGGFGITYAARDTGLDMAVAVKEYFPAEFGMRDRASEVRPVSAGQAGVFEQCRASFLREARTLAQFRHPSIVRVMRVLEANGTAYTVMEFVEGQSLASWAEGLGRRPRQSEIDGILRPLIGALDELHAASFIHRDIAPDNVLIRKDGTPVLIDFGAARQVLVEASRNFTGIVKQGYSPPEQYAMDAKLQGPWTDIYALGGVLYGLVTGEKPVPAPERQLGIRMTPAAETRGGGYRRGFLAGIDRALEIAPGDRPQSLSALKEMLLEPERPQTVRVDRHVATEVLHAPPPARGARVPLTVQRNLGVVLPVLAAVLAGAGLIWASGGFGGGDPSAVRAEREQREVAERQRVAAAEKPVIERAEAERQRQEALRRAEAERQRFEADRRAQVEKDAEAARRRAAEAEGQRQEAERQRQETERRAALERQADAERQRQDGLRRAEAERQRLDAERRVQAEREAEDARRRAAEVERERLDADRKAGTERQAAEERQRQEAAQLAEAERQRLAAERLRVAAAEKQAADRRAAEQRTLIADIRRELARVGCTSRGTTPGWTDDDQRALQRFVENAGGGIAFPALDREIVRVLQGFRQRVCPLQCAAGETEADGRCVPAQVAPGTGAPGAGAAAPPGPSAAIQCRQINERAQLGLLTDEDRQLLRRLNCR